MRYDLVAAILLFLTSATAVSAFGARVSDLAAAALFVLIAFAACRRSEAMFSPRTAMPAVLLIGTILFSTTLQLIFASESARSDGASNAIAIPLGIAVAFLLLRRVRPEDQLNVLAKYCYTVVFGCAALLAHQFYFGIPSWIQIIDDTNRFSALALNPNQLALYLLPIPFFALTLLSIGRLAALPAVALVAGAVAINFFAFGKALFSAWIVGFFVVGLFGLKRAWTLRRMMFWGAVLVVAYPLWHSYLLPVIEALYVGDAPGSVQGQGDARVSLWTNGLIAWLDAPLMGHGPGHYSGLDRPYEGLEAHNFAIDWLTAYGIAGFAALLALVWSILSAVMSTRSWIVVGFYTCLAIQSMFHFYGRQPVFWIWCAVGLTMCGVLAQRKDTKCVV